MARFTAKIEVTSWGEVTDRSYRKSALSALQFALSEAVEGQADDEGIKVDIVFSDADATGSA